MIGSLHHATGKTDAPIRLWQQMSCFITQRTGRTEPRSYPSWSCSALWFTISPPKSTPYSTSIPPCQASIHPCTGLVCSWGAMNMLYDIKLVQGWRKEPAPAYLHLWIALPVRLAEFRTQLFLHSLSRVRREMAMQRTKSRTHFLHPPEFYAHFPGNKTHWR